MWSALHFGDVTQAAGAVDSKWQKWMWGEQLEATAFVQAKDRVGDERWGLRDIWELKWP